MSKKQLILKGVKVHNLKSVDLKLDHHQLVVFTGVSGSGKSSLAFDTLYVEGQRRYVESLSTFARRYLGDMERPDLEHVEGLTPTISVEQKTAGNNPRSTVGTMTEIYDYLRVLYARVGTPHCPVSGEPVLPRSRERILKEIQALPPKTRAILLAPYAQGKKGEFREDFRDLLRKGFLRARVDGEMVDLSQDISLDRNLSHDVDVVIDRLVVDDKSASRIADGVGQALELGQGVCKVLLGDEERLYSMHAYSQASGESYTALEPHDFSFNSPNGMCDKCNGMGTTQEYDFDKVINPDLSIRDECCSIAPSIETVRYGNIYRNLGRLFGFRLSTPWKKLSEDAKKVFLYGTEKKWTRMSFIHPDKGTRWNDHVQWRGVIHEAHQRYRDAKSASYRKRAEALMSEQTCQECGGARLKAYPAATLLDGKSIQGLTQMTIAECQRFFEELVLIDGEAIIAEELLKEIRQRLYFLQDVGLHYLTLDRTAPTLSGGEAQRVRLASQIGCGLVGVTYILDEPSIGLHPRDNRKLIKTLESLRDKGNTVIVVEHDEETMWAADRIVEFGPNAGIRGGEILVNGSMNQLLRCKRSLTGSFLRGEREIRVPDKRRKGTGKKLTIKGATHHNLKKLDCKIPLGKLVAVTGVSGSGKSSLITDILHPVLSNTLHHGEHTVGAHKTISGIDEIDKVIAIDQSPIGRNPRSNPSTYIKLFDEIRDLFCKLPESLARGYQPGRFSFNVAEGSCRRCKGMGQIKIDMDFMESAWLDCPICETRRFDHETLGVLYKGKNISDILDMEVQEAFHFFSAIPSISKKLETLIRVGMDYVKLGQPSTTLSGGEAQRIKLAKELVRPATGRTLYILDEPTTGLHFHDIQHLLVVLDELVERGNTVLVIEHNMDVVKTADWVIDLGPEGGAGGGQLIGEGTPEKICKMDTPTGQAIWEALHPVETREKWRNRAREATGTEQIKAITVQGAEENNLKSLDLTIPRGKMTVCTGPSGSGKTSLALDTIFAEGQRRYIESLSPYARQFVTQMQKPRVRQVEGLSPAIAIEQKAHAGNPRSTVGTMTELYDYLRLLYARVGTPHCPDTGEVIKAISKDHVVDRLINYPEKELITVLAPIAMKRSDKFEEIVSRYQRQGFLRIRLNGEIHRLEEEIPFDRKRKNDLQLVIDRIKVSPSGRNRIAESVEVAAEVGEGHIVVLHEDRELPFNLAFAVESTGQSYPEITPQTFAFNTLTGMCHDCQGLGTQFGANLLADPTITNLRLDRFFRLIWGAGYFAMEEVLDTLCEEEEIALKAPINRIGHRQQQLIFRGSGETSYTTPSGFTFRWPGIEPALSKLGKSAHTKIKESLLPLLHESPCLSCNGTRLNPLARNVTIRRISLPDLCEMPIRDTLDFIEGIDIGSEEKTLDEVKSQLLNRLNFLNDVGLHYLSLDRRAPTLSGGETQRIRLARQLGSALTGVLYVLDEPTIGLHPRDNTRLNEALSRLKKLGNTLLLVEHDPLTIDHADYLLDFGPGAGTHGGHITARGTLPQIRKNSQSLTGQYLTGKRRVSRLKERRPINTPPITIKEANVHNLKNLSVEIPTEALTCVSGVSGSGKSSLVQGVLASAFTRQGRNAKVTGLNKIGRQIIIDQNPVGHTVRSIVATYTDVLTDLRNLFCQVPEARIRGLMPKHFSANHRSGMCTHCWGLGHKKVEMHFLPPVRITCPECKGLRLRGTSLEITYDGKNLGEYLLLTAEEVRDIFENHYAIKRKLDTLIAVGLGYLTLGQEVATLSGGEAQRIKLSRELAKRSTGDTLYLLDEPTTGLHPDDIEKLMKVLHNLVDKGNTMVIIEHNLDVLLNADWLIDLGPDAGDQGGNLVCAGRPEEVAQHPTSHTGRFLKAELARD